MARIRRGASGNKRREEILNKAALLFREKGYSNVTMDDLAKSLDASKLSIYYYFESKEDLLFQISERSHRRSLEILREISATDDPPDKKLHDLLIGIMNHYMSVQTPSILITREINSLAPEHHEEILKAEREFMDQVLQILQEGIQQKRFIDCDLKLAYLAMIGAVNFTLSWYRPDGPLTKQQVARFFAGQIMRSLLYAPAPYDQLPADDRKSLKPTRKKSS